MKESRIIAFIGLMGCLNMANTSEGNYVLMYIALAIFWLGRYVYLKNRK